MRANLSAARAWARGLVEPAAVTVVAAAGVALVSAGVALYSLPAGLIVAGLELLLLLGGYLRGVR